MSVFQFPLKRICSRCVFTAFSGKNLCGLHDDGHVKSLAVHQDCFPTEEATVLKKSYFVTLVVGED